MQKCWGTKAGVHVIKCINVTVWNKTAHTVRLDRPAEWKGRKFFVNSMYALWDIQVSEVIVPVQLQEVASSCNLVVMDAHASSFFPVLLFCADLSDIHYAIAKVFCKVASSYSIQKYWGNLQKWELDLDRWTELTVLEMLAVSSISRQEWGWLAELPAQSSWRAHG